MQWRFYNNTKFTYLMCASAIQQFYKTIFLQKY